MYRPSARIHKYSISLIICYSIYKYSIHSIHSLRELLSVASAIEIFCKVIPEIKMQQIYVQTTWRPRYRPTSTNPYARINKNKCPSNYLHYLIKKSQLCPHISFMYNI